MIRGVRIRSAESAFSAFLLAKMCSRASKDVWGQRGKIYVFKNTLSRADVASDRINELLLLRWWGYYVSKSASASKPFRWEGWTHSIPPPDDLVLALSIERDPR